MDPRQHHRMGLLRAAVEVGLPTADELARIARPEAMLTVDQIDRIPLVGVVGKREAERIWVARRG